MLGVPNKRFLSQFFALFHMVRSKDLREFVRFLRCCRCFGICRFSFLSRISEGVHSHMVFCLATIAAFHHSLSWPCWLWPFWFKAAVVYARSADCFLLCVSVVQSLQHRVCGARWSKQCWEFHYLGEEQRPSRVLGSSDFGLCFCVWFPLGACSCSVALLSFGRLVLRIRGTDVISRLQHSSAVACPRKSLMSKC